MPTIDEAVDRRLKWMRWTGRGIGWVIGGLWVLSLLAHLIGDLVSGGSPPETEGILLGVLVSIPVTGVVVTWWREKSGGVLAVIGGIALGTFAYVTAGRNKVWIMLFAGVPFVVSGTLFLLSWRRCRAISE